jgi:hypothetical protein
VSVPRRGARRWLDRPVSPGEPQVVLLTAIAALLIGAALLLAVTDVEAPRQRATTRDLTAPHRQVPRDDNRFARWRASTVVRRFLAGYLPFAYGQRSAGSVRDATRELQLALAHRTIPAPSGLRRLHPRVVGVKIENVSGGATATALVKDGEVLVYPIALRLTESGGRLLVAEVGG